MSAKFSSHSCAEGMNPCRSELAREQGPRLQRDQMCMSGESSALRKLPVGTDSAALEFADKVRSYGISMVPWIPVGRAGVTHERASPAMLPDYTLN